MKIVSSVRTLAAFVFRRPQVEREMEEELRSHLQSRADDLERSGLSRADAERQARIEFGGYQRYTEECRDALGTRVLGTLYADVKYGLRQLGRSPGFTLVAVVTLALGIGGSAAMFTVINAVLLKPLAYGDPDRLVQISGGATEIRFEEMRAVARSFTDIGAYTGGLENVTISGGSEPEALKGARVSANFLTILGVAPLLGRGFLPREDAPGGPAVAMISAELWRRRFGGDSLIAGRTATINATPYTVVGVLPPGFRFPFPDVDVWLTRPSEWSIIWPAKSRSLSPILAIFGRLKPGVTLKQAQAEMAVIYRQYMAAHRTMLDAKPRPAEQVTPLKEHLVGGVRSMIWMLAGAVGFVLLISCANVASLLMARGASRSQEFAVRTALGAARSRLLVQLLTESLLLAVTGGALGVLLAQWSMRGLRSVSALDLPRTGEVHLDGLVLAFALALSIATGVLFGLFPSLQVSQPDLARALRDSAAGASGTSGRPGAFGLSARGLLVMGQVALSMILLVGAALLLESMARLAAVDPGFQPSGLLTMRIPLPAKRYDSEQKRAAFFSELTRRVESLPGVHSAGVTLTLPMTGFAGSPVHVVGRPLLRLNQRPIAIVQSVTPDYFRTLGIPLRRGREFTDHDDASAARVVVINERLARRFWPAYPGGENPVGQHILVGSGTQPLEIVGIVRDIHQASLASDDPWPGVYIACAQSPPQTAMMAVRTQGDPRRFVSAARHEVASIDRDQPISDVKTMIEVVEESQGQRRLVLTLLGLFAGTALVLTIVGIYGVVSYTVAQRTHELGIRQALGAERGDILRLVLRQGAGLALSGIAVGTGGALALNRVMQSLLFHVSATDSLTYVAVGVVFLTVALAASYIPARRATKVDPMVALRYE